MSQASYKEELLSTLVKKHLSKVAVILVKKIALKFIKKLRQYSMDIIRSYNKL